MADADDETTRAEQHEELPGPHEDRDTGASGSTDERSSENRRKGLQKDGENLRDGEAAAEAEESA